MATKRKPRSRALLGRQLNKLWVEKSRLAKAEKAAQKETEAPESMEAQARDEHMEVGDEAAVIVTSTVTSTAALSSPQQAGDCIEVMHQLYYDRNSEVLVCKTCRTVVLNPRHHLKKYHSLTVRDTKVFSDFKVKENWKPERGHTMRAIPFIEVEDGVKCKICGTCCKEAKNLSCKCSAGVVEAKIQRFGEGRSDVKSAVLVEDVNLKMVHLEGVEYNLADLVTENLTPPAAACTGPQDERTIFYSKLSFFGREGEVEEFVKLGLLGYFDTPAGVPAGWEAALRKHLRGALEWVEGLPKPFKDLCGYHSITAKTRDHYANEFVQIINYALNVGLKPICGTDRLKVNFRLEAARNLLKKIDDSVFDVVESLQSEELRAENFTVIDSMLRAYCIDRKSFELKNARFVQPITSVVMKLFRVCVLVQAFRRCKPGESPWSSSAGGFPVAHSDEEDDDEVEREIQNDGDLEERQITRLDCGCVSECVCTSPMGTEVKKGQPYLDRESMNPIRTVVDMKNLAMFYADQLKPRIVPMGDDKYQVDGALADLRQMEPCVRGMVAEFQALVKKQSLGAATFLAIEQLKENYRRQDSVEHVDQKWARELVLTTVVRNPELYAKCVAAVVDGKIVFRDDFCKEYLRDQERLEELMLALMHLAGGMPGRATELERLRFSSRGGGVRNIFLFDEFLMIEPTYSKTDHSARSTDKFRFLPQKESLLVFRVLLFIRPFADLVARSQCVKNYRGDYLDRVFISKSVAMDARTVSNKVTKVVSEFGFPMSFSNLRHIMKYIFNLKLADMCKTKGLPTRVRDLHALSSLNEHACKMAGHKVSTGSREYAFDTLQHQRFNGLELLGQAAVSMVWWILVGIFIAVFTRTESVACQTEEPEEVVERKVKAKTKTVQKSRGGRVKAGKSKVEKSEGEGMEGMDFAMKAMGELIGACKALVEGGMSGSKAQEAVIAAIKAVVEKGASGEDGSDGEKSESTQEAMDVSDFQVEEEQSEIKPREVQPSRATQLPVSGLAKFQEVMAKDLSSDASRFLERLLKKDARWKSPEQLAAVKRALGSENFLCVLPTGGGKSFIFFIASLSQPDLITLVLTPTRALRDDLLSKARGHSLECSDVLTAESKGLVFLCYEMIQTDQQKRLIVDLCRNLKRVNRVFYDEAHALVLEKDRSPTHFLPLLAGLCPTTLLTATAPKVVESKLLVMYDSQVSGMSVIRASTNRPNIRYVVESCEEGDRLRRMVKEIRECKEGDRVLIYAHGRDEVERIGKLLRQEGIAAEIYHAKLPSDVKEQNAARWTSGESIVMVGTTAFCAGIDLSCVTLVIVDGLPYTLEDFVQMAGRGGRAGMKSKSLLLYCTKQENSWIFMEKKKNSSESREFLLKFAQDDRTCRRGFVTEAMDGAPVNCADAMEGSERNELCDNCESRRADQVVKSPRRLEVAKLTEKKAQEILADQLAVSRVKVIVNACERNRIGSCVLCKACGPSDHVRADCHKPRPSCNFCLDLSALHSPHIESRCPFRESAKGACGICWRPGMVQNHFFHEGEPFGKFCKKFSIKMFWIYIRSREEGMTCAELEGQYLTAIKKEDNFVNGVVWFVEYVTSKPELASEI